MILCPSCHHSIAIHDRSGACPRWARDSLSPRTRVAIRIGDKWDGYEGHILAYFVDYLDTSTDQMLILDLTTGEQFEGPRETASTNRSGRYTRPANVRERQTAADDVEMRLGERVEVVRRMMPKRS